MRETKASIQMGHFGNLPAIAAQIADGDKTAVPLGYIVGRANGVSYRSNPNGDEPSVGIKGLFEATPVTEGMPVMVAPLIFLPTAFAKTLETALLGSQKAPKKAPPKGKPVDLDGVAEIPLALEIGLRKNTGGGVGYEFAVTQLNDAKDAIDPFTDLRTALPAIAHRAAPALPAPDKSAKAGKGGGRKRRG